MLRTPGRTASALLLLAAGIPSAGCSTHTLDVALGSAFEVVIVSDASLAPVRERARGLLEQTIYLSFREERLYNVEQVSLGEDTRISWQSRKNVLILGAGQAPAALMKVLGPELTPRQREAMQAPETRLFRISDPWNRFQNVTVMWAPTPHDLERALAEKGEDVLHFVEEGALGVLGRVLLNKGEQEDLRLSLQSEYGWGIRMPIEYRANLQHAGEGFVSFRADDPPRLLFVRWMEGVSELPGGEEALSLRDHTGEQFYQGDRVVMDRSDAGQREFLGRPAVFLDGQWENRPLVIGGPFRSYLFRVPEQDRLYLLDVAVYLPGDDKLLPLRELEALARTFTVQPAGTVADAGSSG